MIRTSAVRFVLVVSPTPVWMRAAFALAVVMSLATLWFSSAEVDAALGPILLLQMFAASNGYLASASRGYFDPILVSGRSRTRIAAGNFAAAALPGLVSWTVIVFAASALGQFTTAAAPHRLMALVLVSSTAWSAGLLLPRLASGALWSLLLVALAMSHGSIADYLQAAQTTPASFRQVLVSASAGTVCPFLLLSDFPGMTDPRVLSIEGLVSVGFAMAGMRFVSLREYALGERA